MQLIGISTNTQLAAEDAENNSAKKQVELASKFWNQMKLKSLPDLKNKEEHISSVADSFTKSLFNLLL